MCGLVTDPEAAVVLDCSHEISRSGLRDEVLQKGLTVYWPELPRSKLYVLLPTKLFLHTRLLPPLRTDPKAAHEWTLIADVG